MPIVIDGIEITGNIELKDDCILFKSGYLKGYFFYEIFNIAKLILFFNQFNILAQLLIGIHSSNFENHIIRNYLPDVVLNKRSIVIAVNFAS